VTTLTAERTHYEYDTDPFTPAERHGIDRFETAVETSGIRDCFDGFDADSIRDHATEFGELGARSLLREYAGYLKEWYLAVDGLIGDMLTCTSEYSRYSTAAARYLRDKAADYHRTRQDFEYAVTVWTLGLDPSPLGDYPLPTRELSLGMQGLTCGE
jgi:hypothetical protein